LVVRDRLFTEAKLSAGLAITSGFAVLSFTPASGSLKQYTSPSVSISLPREMAHKFFDITDGPVPEIRLAAAVPNQDGTFRVSFTDFTAGAETAVNTQDAAIQLFLRDSNTWNLLAAGLIPEPEEYRSISGSLKIMSVYPSLLYFVPDPRWQSF
jgi:hypothetical protein